MKPFDNCPVCNGELVKKHVEKILRGGDNTISLKVIAEVCLRCGERLYSEDTVKSFQEIRKKLMKQEFTHFRNIGNFFTLDSTWPNKTIQPISCGECGRL